LEGILGPGEMRKYRDTVPKIDAVQVCVGAATCSTTL
jgi:hypothetical protein